MQVHATAAALDKNREVGGGLRACEHSQAFGLNVAQRDVFQFVGGNHEEYAVVGAAFLQLARGMQVAGANLEAAYDAEFVGDAVANNFERFATPLAVERQERIEREVVARFNRRE